MAGDRPTGIVPTSTADLDDRLLPVFVAAGLIDDRLISNLVEREVTSVAARLEGYRRVELGEVGWAVLEPAADESVDGSVLLALAAEDLRRLDAYRGVGEGLYRRAVAVAWIELLASSQPVFIYLPTERTLRRLAGR